MDLAMELSRIYKDADCPRIMLGLDKVLLLRGQSKRD